VSHDYHSGRPARGYLAGRLRDYSSSSGWRHQARLLLAEHGIEAISPVYAPWVGDAPPALTPQAVELPDLQQMLTCQYILVAGGAGSGTGFALGYAFARRERDWTAPAHLVWVTDEGSPPPFIRLWDPVCQENIQAAVEWIVCKEVGGSGD
jgi:hypothetical protein